MRRLRVQPEDEYDLFLDPNGPFFRYLETLKHEGQTDPEPVQRVREQMDRELGDRSLTDQLYEMRNK